MYFHFNEIGGRDAGIGLGQRTVYRFSQKPFIANPFQNFFLSLSFINARTSKFEREFKLQNGSDKIIGAYVWILVLRQAGEVTAFFFSTGRLLVTVNVLIFWRCVNNSYLALIFWHYHG